MPSSTSPTYQQIQTVLNTLCGRTSFLPILPYEYSGVDYTLALHAIFPRDVVVLHQLCWADHPAAFQLENNLLLFVTACLKLPLDNAPLSSLTVASLQPEPTNFVHHVVVQQWLWQLATVRFPVNLEQFGEASAVRSRMRREQLQDALFRMPPDAHGYCRVHSNPMTNTQQQKQNQKQCASTTMSSTVAAADNNEVGESSMPMTQLVQQQLQHKQQLLNQLQEVKAAVVEQCVSRCSQVGSRGALPFEDWAAPLSQS